jgi:hypothetical protein
VTLTGSVLYGELKGLELFDPSGDLYFRLFKGHEPPQSSMISANGEWKAAEDVLEMVYCINHCQKYLARHTIVPLRLIQGTTVVSNNLLGTKACVASIRVKDKWHLLVWCSQHWIFT